MDGQNHIKIDNTVYSTPNLKCGDQL